MGTIRLRRSEPGASRDAGFRTITRHPDELDVSFVIPVLNEVENVAGLADEVSDAFGTAGRSWECVWVDDGSTDGTGALLDAICENDRRHRVLHFRRNYGQSAAMAEGISAARGAVVVTLDGDGQSDPADAPRLLALLEERGADMVNGVRTRRRDSRIRRISSRIGNGFRNRITRESVTDVGCSLRAVRRECFDGILVFRGMHRFLPTLIRLNGHDRIIEVPVAHRPRRHGTTKYGVRNRLWVGLADTLAVAWMQRRLVSPRVARAAGTDGGGRDDARVARAGAPGTGRLLGAVSGSVARE